MSQFDQGYFMNIKANRLSLSLITLPGPACTRGSRIDRSGNTKRSRKAKLVDEYTVNGIELACASIVPAQNLASACSSL